MNNFRRGNLAGRQSQFGRGGFGQRANRGGQSGHRNPGLLLNPMMFVRKAEYADESGYEPKNNWADFKLHETVRKNIEMSGYVKPTAIQDQVINLVSEGRDVVGLANTGTGKTAAFLLPLVTRIAEKRSWKVLIVTPTRELAVQINEEIRKFANGLGIGTGLCIGGASIGQQVRELRRMPSFVIGTPGRLIDLEQQRMLNLGQFGTVVLDEVDRMLDMGFVRDVKEIVGKLPAIRQSLFFSATLPEPTKQIMQSFLKNPVTVSVKTGNTAKNVDQDIIRTAGKNKLELLHDLLIRQEFTKVVVFGRTKHGVKKLEESLNKRGFKTASIHGNKSQGQRLRALQMIKNDQAKILLATDVAARGLDIDDISHVINYDVPESYEDYVHRIGRTGRAGKKGVALTFVE